MIELEEFKSKCKLHKCFRQTMISPQCDKEYKQELCYKKYIQKQEKDQAKRNKQYQDQRSKPILVDEKWIELKKQIMVRDKAQCRFYSICTPEEKKIIDLHLWGDFKILDGAHYKSRSSSPSMKYDVDNVYLIFRYLHKCLDEAIDPFTQESISKDQVEEYWLKIIGKEKYDELNIRAKRKK